MPFSEASLVRERTAIVEHLGLSEQQCQVADRQPFRLGMLAELLRVAGDPDWEFLHRLEEGVSLGVDEEMDRTPAVFEEKTRWNLDECFEPGAAEAPNYRRVADYAAQVEELFTSEAEDGWMVRLTNEQATRKYRNRLHIAALAVIDEGDKVRVIHDGSNNVMVNHRIRPRDQLRSLGAGEGASGAAPGEEGDGSPTVGSCRRRGQGPSSSQDPRSRLGLPGLPH